MISSFLPSVLLLENHRLVMSNASAFRGLRSLGGQRLADLPEKLVKGCIDIGQMDLDYAQEGL